MENKYKDLLSVTNEEKEKISNNTTKVLPLEPSAQGYNPQVIRQKQWYGICGDKESLLALLINRFGIVGDYMDEEVTRFSELLEKVLHIVNTNNCIDIVMTKSELDNYINEKLMNGNKITVIHDETQNDVSVVYEYIDNQWTKYSTFKIDTYTKEEINNFLSVIETKLSQIEEIEEKVNGKLSNDIMSYDLQTTVKPNDFALIHNGTKFVRVPKSVIAEGSEENIDINNRGTYTTLEEANNSVEDKKVNDYVYIDYGVNSTPVLAVFDNDTGLFAIVGATLFLKSEKFDTFLEAYNADNAIFNDKIVELEGNVSKVEEKLSTKVDKQEEKTYVAEFEARKTACDESNTYFEIVDGSVGVVDYIEGASYVSENLWNGGDVKTNAYFYSVFSLFDWNSLPKDVPLYFKRDYKLNSETGAIYSNIIIYFEDVTKYITWGSNVGYTIESAWGNIANVAFYGNTDTSVEDRGATYSNIMISTSDIPYTPYFSGFRYAKPTGIKSVGVNLWNEKWEVGSISNDGTLNNSVTSSIRSVDYTNVIPNTQLRLIFTDAGAFYYYDKDYKFIAFDYTSTNKFIYDVPNNAYYFKYRCGANYGTIYKNDTMITYDLNATEYQPYNEYNFNLPNELINHNSWGITGNKYYPQKNEFVVGYANYTINGNESGWFSGTTTNDCYVARILVTSLFPYDSTKKQFPINTFSETTKNSDEGKVYSGEQEGMYFLTNFTISIHKSKLSSEDLNGVLNYIKNNPITIQYELATPTTETIDTEFISYPVSNDGMEIIQFKDYQHPCLTSITYTADNSKQIEELTKDLALTKKDLETLRNDLVLQKENIESLEKRAKYPLTLMGSEIDDFLNSQNQSIGFIVTGYDIGDADFVPYFINFGATEWLFAKLNPAKDGLVLSEIGNTELMVITILRVEEQPTKKLTMIN